MTGHHKSIGAVERVWGGDKWHVWSGDSAGSIRVWEGEDLRFLRQLDSGQVSLSHMRRAHCMSVRPLTRLAVLFSFSLWQGRIFSIKAVGPHVWTGAERSLQIRDARGVLVKEAPGAVYSICPIGIDAPLFALSCLSVRSLAHVIRRMRCRAREHGARVDER